MGLITTSSKKEQLKKASSTYLGTFRRIVKGLTDTNKQIDAEQEYAKKSIESLKKDLQDYDQIKQENQGVIDGLNTLLGLNTESNG